MSYDPRVTERERVIAELRRHCDVVERMSLVPPSQGMRGIYLRSIETVLDRADRLPRYRALFPDRVSMLRFYPMSEFLERLAIGASVLTSPERVAEGMYEIGRDNAFAVSESVLGRILYRLLARDPRKLLQQGLAGRRQTVRAPPWELTFPTERSAIVTMREEYGYIESYLLGAAQGTFDAVSIPVRIEVELEHRFSGRHLIFW